MPSPVAHSASLWAGANINVRWVYGCSGLVSEASVAHSSSPCNGVLPV